MSKLYKLATVAILIFVGVASIGSTSYIPPESVAGPYYVTGTWKYDPSYGWESSQAWDTLPDTASGTAETVTTGKFICQSDSLFMTGIVDGDSTHASNPDSVNLRVILYQTFDDGVTYVKVDSVDIKAVTYGNGAYYAGAFSCVRGKESYFTYQSQLTTLDTTRFNLEAYGYLGHLRP